MTGYQVLRKLADGSAAEVFLARDGHSPSKVVLEVIRPELTTDFEVYGRFLDEAKQRQSLTHPNLLRRRSTGCAPDGRLYAVTEPIDGEHLGSLLSANGPLAPAELVRLMVPLCEALEYLHAKGKVHGLLRPCNVFLSRGPKGLTPKLLDTGLSLLRPGRSIVTSPSIVLVEPEYLSPERIRGRRGGLLSDIYGLGVLMYEALTGAPPFTSADPALTRRLHLESEPRPLPARCERLAPIVMRCLAKNPARRFQSMAAVRHALSWSTGLAPSTSILALEEGPVDESIEFALEELVEEPAYPTILGEPVGEVLGSYELEDLLGQGGMGRVFLARHRKLGRQVALKVLRPELAADPTQLKRFFQEGQAVNRINNPHIVQIYDFVEESREQGGRVYCVMEPLTGHSLRDLAAQGPLPISRAVAIMRQACSALGAAHQAGIVHRDVKPDNIFLVEAEGQRDYVKLLDFGIAKLEAAINDPRLPRTRAGIVVGTPAYMAPEQALGEAVDGRADVYSLGTVLFGLLAGRRPFDAASMAALLTHIVTRPAPPLPSHTTGGEPIPEALAAVVAQCLCKKPADRPQSMAQLSAALAPFQAAPEPGAASSFALPQPVPAAAHPEPARSPPLPAPAAAAAAAQRRVQIRGAYISPWLIAIALGALLISALWWTGLLFPPRPAPAKPVPAAPATPQPEPDIRVDEPPRISSPRQALERTPP